MSERPTSAPRAVAALDALVADLAAVRTPDYAARVGGQLRAQQAAGPRAAARRAVAAVGAMAACLAVVAGGVVVRGLEDRTAPVAAPAAPTTRVVDLADARAAMPFDLSLPIAGEPARVVVADGDPAPYVSLLYGEPEARGLGRMVRGDYELVQIAGSAAPHFDVMTRNDPAVRRVAVGGNPGLWFPAAAPLLYSDADGVRRTLAPRSASGALVWVRGGVTFRLEVDAPLDSALLLALGGARAASDGGEDSGGAVLREHRPSVLLG